MLERIQLLLKVKNLTASRFADEIGFQRSGLSHIMSGRNLPSLDFVQKVLTRYSEISPEWLLKGEGQMFKTKQIDLFVEEAQAIQEPEPEVVPLRDKVVQKPVIEDVKEETVPEYKLSEEKPVKETPEPKSESELNAKNPAEEQKNPKENASRKITRVLVFYSDKTFSEYFPEEVL